MSETLNITGTLRSREGQESYTFSVKAFKAWKQRFLGAYQEQYQVRFDHDFPDSRVREALYKAAHNMNFVDIFGTSRETAGIISEAMYDRVMRVQNILTSRS